MDFIGQKAPTSRFTLLILDLVVLAIQCFMLAVHSERERLRSVVRPFRARSGSAGSVEDAAIAAAERPSTQDHDAEERGVSRDVPGERADETFGYELQDLGRGPGDRNGDDGDERTPFLNGSREPPGGRSHLSELLSSGNGILGEFHILHTIRTATTDYESAAAHSIQTLGYTAALAALTAQRRVPVTGTSR